MKAPKPAGGRVVVVGSINLDVRVQLDTSPGPGDTVLARRTRISGGGKGANQAAARRLGAPILLLGAVGTDPFAAPALALLERFGVDLTHVERLPGERTGLAWIEVDRNGQNRITVAPGANRRVGKTTLRHLAEVLQPSDLLLLQGEIPPRTVVAAARLGKERGARVFLDPAPPHPAFRGALRWVDGLFCPTGAKPPFSWGPLPPRRPRRWPEPVCFRPQTGAWW